jgi:hypothetical protein
MTIMAGENPTAAQSLFVTAGPKLANHAGDKIQTPR